MKSVAEPTYHQGSNPTGPTEFILSCGNKIKIVADNDANAFVKAILQTVDEPAKTPETYYDYYYWENIIKKIQSLFQK